MNKDEMPFEVKCVAIEEIATIALIHQGSPSLLPQSIQQFITHRKALGLSPQNSRTFNILFHDPSTTPAHLYKFGLCTSLNNITNLSHSELQPFSISEGLCATIRLIGGDSQLPSAIQYLVNTWLVESNHELRDFPLFLERIKFGPDVSEDEMITDIYLPITQK